MQKLKEGLLAYLSATDSKETQVALDAMATGIKADIIQVIEETLAEVQSANGGKSLNIGNNRVDLAAKNLLKELSIRKNPLTDWIC